MSKSNNAYVASIIEHDDAQNQAYECSICGAYEEIPVSKMYDGSHAPYENELCVSCYYNHNNDDNLDIVSSDR